MSKEIWVPKSETKVTVKGDEVIISTEMIMTAKTIQVTGFERPS